MYRPAPGTFRLVAILASVALIAGCRDDMPTAVADGEPPTGELSSPRLGAPLLAAAPWGGGAILVSPTGLDFGDVPVGTTAPAQEVTVTNVGTLPVVMSGTGGAAGVFGGAQDCQGNTLAVGASCRIFYAFAPTAAGDQSVTTGGTWNGEPFEIELRGRGMGPRFRISGTSFDFGNVPVGTSAEQEVTVTNVGVAPVTVAMAGGAAGDFGGSQNCQGNTLAVGASCQITYTFAPTAAGVVTGSTGGSVNGQPFAFAFRGNGVAPTFRITPTAIDFGEVATGSSLQQAVTVTNTSIVPVTVSMAGGAAGAFGGAQNCQGNTLAPGASCEISYTFAPSSAGLVTGSTGGSVNGQPFALDFRGTGIASEGARTLQFRIAHTGLDFGTVQAGQSVQQQVDIVNVGASPVTISMAGGAAGPFGGAQNCQGNTLAAGASCQISYTFAPTAAGLVTGSTGGTVNGQPFAFTFRGAGMTPWFRLSPTAIDFGALQVGTSLQQAVTVTNVGSDPAVISMAGGAAGEFGGAQNCQGNTLAPGDSCEIFYTFAPTAAGVVTGSTGGSINDQPFALDFRGEGLDARFRVTPFAWDFGPQVVGTSTQRTVSVTNVGAAAATVSMAGGAAGIFGGAQNCQGNTLAVGAGCEISYTFAPTAPGLVSGTTGGSINGQPFAFAMHGTGIGVTYTFLGFGGALERRRDVVAGATVPVRFAFGDAAAAPLSDEEATSFAAACRVTVTFSGTPGAAQCAVYDEASDAFGAQLKIPRGLTPGTYLVTARLTGGTATLAEGTTSVVVR